nr:hypothetical protein [uncultured bacterium]
MLGFFATPPAEDLTAEVWVVVVRLAFMSISR